MRIFPFAINYTAAVSNSTVNSISVYGGAGNITAAPGIGYDIPAGSLTADINLNVAGISNEADYIEVYNRNTDFRVIFTGALVYLSDETVQTDAFALTNTLIRKVNGKLRIIN